MLVRGALFTPRVKTFIGSGLFWLSLLATACGNPPTTEPPPIGLTVEALPTFTLTAEALASPESDATATQPPEASPGPAGTATALIGVTPRPTAIPFFTAPPATATPVPSPTPEAGPAAGGPLVIDNVILVDAVRDPSRENGAIATLSVEFYGGLPPYTVLDEDQAAITSDPFGAFERGGQNMFWIHYQALTTCEAALPRRVGIVSADGQTAELEYWIDRVTCSD